MSRFAVLFRHPRRSLAALATLLVAAAVVVGSGAVFATQTSNPSNTFASGILKQTNSNSGSAILTASQLIPGSSQNGVVDITNDGTVAGKFSLSEANLVDQDSSNGTTGAGGSRSSNKLSDQLDLKVWDCGLWSGSPSSAPSCPADSAGGTLYSGKLSAFTSSVSLGTYAVNDKHRYKFLVSLPDNGTTGLGTLTNTSVGGSGDNAYSGAFTSATFNFNSTSS